MQWSPWSPMNAPRPMLWGTYPVRLQQITVLGKLESVPQKDEAACPGKWPLLWYPSKKRDEARLRDITRPKEMNHLGRSKNFSGGQDAHTGRLMAKQGMGELTPGGRLAKGWVTARGRCCPDGGDVNEVEAGAI